MTKWVQRDLEEQIAEEKGETFIKSSKKQINNMSTTTPTKKKISLTEVQSCLKSGMTRLKKKDLGYGSIQEKYNLSASQVAELFQHPELKGLKVKVPSIEVVDDRPEGEKAAPVATAQAAKDDNSEVFA